MAIETGGVPDGQIEAVRAETTLPDGGSLDTEAKGEMEMRAHHVGVAQSFTRGTRTAEEFAAEQARVYARMAAYAPGNYYRRLARDYVGFTPREQSGYREGATKFFQRYEDLAPGDEVTLIINGKKDGLCSSCAIGEHCLDSTEKFPLSEPSYLAKISKVAHDLGQGNEISMVASPDGVPMEMRLPAGTLKDVLAVEDFGAIARLKIETAYKNKHGKK